MQVEFQAYAYKTEYGATVERMLDGVIMPQIQQSADMGDDPYTRDWARVGTVRVIVEFDDSNTIVANRIAALNNQLQNVRAENHRREMAVIEEIKKLQAIEYTPAAAS